MISVCWIVLSAGLVLVFRYCSYVREDELVLVGRQYELRSSLLSFWIDLRFVLSRGLKLMKVNSMSKRWLQ
jgi:hypothetical protein